MLRGGYISRLLGSQSSATSFHHYILAASLDSIISPFVYAPNNAQSRLTRRRLVVRLGSTYRLVPGHTSNLLLSVWRVFAGTRWKSGQVAEKKK